MEYKHQNSYGKLFDKFKGSLIGAAVGDALGMPTEYISELELNNRYGGKVSDFVNPSKYHPCSHLTAGQYTDDTQQIIVLTESMVENSGFDMFRFGKSIGEWGHKCATVNHFNRFAGGTSMSASLSLYNGINPNMTGLPSETCGAAMRIVPIGLFYHYDHEKLKNAARDAARITHNSSVAIDSAIFIADIIGSILNGKSHKDSVDSALFQLNSDLRFNLEYVIEMMDEEPDKIARVLGASESVYETVPMALSCFLKYPNEFDKTVIAAANLVPGDTDSIACIAGSISGAYNGFSKIPRRFLERLEDEKKLEKLAEDLLEKSLKHR